MNNHPDFQTLSKAVCQLDDLAAILPPEEVLALARFDIGSITYMARQRALRMIQNTPTPTTQEDLITSMASVWLDAFFAGLRVGDERTRIENEQVLDGSLENGNRRQGSPA